MTIPQNAVAERDSRIDALRAIAIVLVMLWHLQPIQLAPLNPTNPSTIARAQGYLLGIFNLQLTLTAVPLFFVVSLYLFFARPSTQFAYLRHRLSRLGKLFVFWTAIQFLVYYTVAWIAPAAAADANVPLSLFDDILRGGPSLPFVGNSVFYYLFDLIVLTVLGYGFATLSDRVRRATGLGVILFSLLYFEMANLLNITTSYWKLENFVLYIPTAYFLVASPHLPRLRNYASIGFVLFSIQDILLRRGGYNAISYDRVAIYFGAVALFCLLLSQTRQPSNRYVSFLSRYSLGLYALHKYWQLAAMAFLTLVFPLLRLSESTRVLDLQASILALCVAVVTIALTLCSIGVLRLTLLRAYLS